MKWLKKRKKRLRIISLDGLPCSLITQNFFKAPASFTGSLFEQKPPVRMNSTIPPLSIVAWATYATGKNPGMHGVFGFLDRSLSPFELYIPDRRRLNSDSLWRRLSHAGKKVLIMNVPLTYPPEQVNGVLISGFLGVSLEKSVYPADLVPTLHKYDYCLDADRTLEDPLNPVGYIDRLTYIANSRFNAFRHLLTTDEFDFAHLHIMETDRLFHFHWKMIENNPSGPLADALTRFRQTLDDGIRSVHSLLESTDELILMSDHGFCGSEYEVQINQVLHEKGYLGWKSNRDSGTVNVSSDSIAYSLLPGRIYLNLKGREPNGRVLPEESDSTIREVCSVVKDELHSRWQMDVIKSVLMREEVYRGDRSTHAPDAVLTPHRGFELKAKLEPVDEVIYKSPLEGMHTEDDAFVWSLNRSIVRHAPHIVDLYPTILDFFSLRDASAEGDILW